jgi:iron complex outermembrane receptor protein
MNTRARTYQNVDARIAGGEFLISCISIFSGAQNNVDSILGELRTPGYGIANLKTGLKIKGVAMNLTLGNIFGRNYYENLSYQRDPFRSGARVYEPFHKPFISLSPDS